GWRQGPVYETAGAVAPDRVRILRREIGVEPGVRRHRCDRQHVADLGEELIPPLMGKQLARRAALDRSSPRDGISELRVDRVGGEGGVIRESLGGPLAQSGGEGGVAIGVAGKRRWRLHGESRQGLAELLGVEQGAAWRAGWNRGEGARGERAQAVLQRQCAGGREYPPLIKIAASDLAVGERLDDLGPVVARLLRFTLTGKRCFWQEIHVHAPLFDLFDESYCCTDSHRVHLVAAPIGTRAAAYAECTASSILFFD